ncbi:hypothetical protein ACFOG5_23445 [Pedobacter fastidiosus]|uniref:Uncharacterized protein n=1 Tax=Pedobacter fastidiosus TaxID=2765361 RepID=A0ABR7KXB4_9SPHI|nr:hypothetical protein [Pedobacter fastidiosus]MBC6112751.1 hypothetical protein [Pedobacter fastidiosus]
MKRYTFKFAVTSEERRSQSKSATDGADTLLLSNTEVLKDTAERRAAETD